MKQTHTIYMFCIRFVCVTIFVNIQAMSVQGQRNLSMNNERRKVKQYLRQKFQLVGIRDHSDG